MDSLNVISEQLVGLTPNEALDMLRNGQGLGDGIHKASLRVVEKDGELFMVHEDFRPQRINVAVQAGKIIRVVGYG